MARRPPAPVRAIVLLGAFACLFLTVCARQQKAAPETPPAAQNAEPAAQEAPAATPDAAPKPEFFPATKSAGAMY